MCMLSSAWSQAALPTYLHRQECLSIRHKQHTRQRGDERWSSSPCGELDDADWNMVCDVSEKGQLVTTTMKGWVHVTRTFCAQLWGLTPNTESCPLMPYICMHHVHIHIYNYGAPLAEGKQGTNNCTVANWDLRSPHTTTHHSHAICLQLSSCTLLERYMYCMRQICSWGWTGTIVANGIPPAVVGSCML